ncbi:Protein spt10 [Lodderomyces elongisporus]|uniref:Protein spt10 n=1 Tax=Lodderomyces elongisporus TaxID=36914 RepID=UPI0029248ECA|nr:Protein spt10 [Lodderomyces elongisporus]WLF79191.1 Protein spt10 [Lodderomyces elongisporus]
MPTITDRYTVLLKDGVTTATIYPISINDNIPYGLLHFLYEEYNMEIERGETLPFFDPLSIEEFSNYWFESFAAVMCLGDLPLVVNGDSHQDNFHDVDDREWEKECLGAFYIKPNFPGRRCAHICTAEFIVNAGIRGKGIGRTLTDCFLQWAPKLGYTYTMFNLVFESNAAARKLWESLNFKRVGKIANAAYVKGSEIPVDAIIYGRDLMPKPVTGGDSSAYRFDQLKYYLETGKYPTTADKQEKARLRASAVKYSVENGKLMFKGKEVIADPDQQLRICQDAHRSNGHCGINRATTLIAEKYHWTRIKETMGVVVKNCTQCTKSSQTNEESVSLLRPTKKRRINEQTQNGNKSGAGKDNELEADSREGVGLSAHLRAVVSEVQANHREEYRPSYAEVAASSLTNYPSYIRSSSKSNSNSKIRNSTTTSTTAPALVTTQDADLEAEVVRPRVKKYH